MIAVDARNADAMARLSAELGSLSPAMGWRVSTEQELTADNLYVARVECDRFPGHVTLEAYGHRKAGGYEYLVSVFDGAGGLVRGPLSFSMTAHAVFWARTWLVDQ